jgi:hypothetical protein
VVRQTGAILQEDIVMAHYLNFFGDSFTAGDELMDWKYVENYPPYKNFREWSRLSAHERQRPTLDHVDQKKLREEEQQYSYAGLLGGINHGVSGSSMQSIQRRVIHYLENTDQKSIIFIQPTGIERWCEYVNNKWVDFISDSEIGEEYMEYYKFRLSHSTQESNLLLWYNCVLTLIAYVKSHHNTVDWWIINNGTFNEIQSIMKQEKIYSKMITDTFKNLKEKTINFPQVDNMEHPYFCIGGHVNTEAHKELAQKIKKKLQ